MCIFFVAQSGTEWRHLFLKYSPLSPVAWIVPHLFCICQMNKCNCILRLLKESLLINRVVKCSFYVTTFRHSICERWQKEKRKHSDYSNICTELYWWNETDRCIFAPWTCDLTETLQRLFLRAQLLWNEGRGDFTWICCLIFLCFDLTCMCGSDTICFLSLPQLDIINHCLLAVSRNNASYLILYRQKLLLSLCWQQQRKFEVFFHCAFTFIARGGKRRRSKNLIYGNSQPPALSQTSNKLINIWFLCFKHLCCYFSYCSETLTYWMQLLTNVLLEWRTNTADSKCWTINGLYTVVLTIPKTREMALWLETGQLKSAEILRKRNG